MKQKKVAHFLIGQFWICLVNLMLVFCHYTGKWRCHPTERWDKTGITSLPHTEPLEQNTAAERWDQAWWKGHSNGSERLSKRSVYAMHKLESTSWSTRVLWSVNLLLAKPTEQIVQEGIQPSFEVKLRSKRLIMSKGRRQHGDSSSGNWLQLF